MMGTKSQDSGLVVREGSGISSRREILETLWHAECILFYRKNKGSGGVKESWWPSSADTGFPRWE